MTPSRVVSASFTTFPYVVEVIPVHYGLPGWKGRKLTEKQEKWLEEERAACLVSFPYSHPANKAGGCVVQKAKYAKVSYCPECRKVDEAWHAKHGRSPLAEKQN
jgi:hypothetical protein